MLLRRLASLFCAVSLTSAGHQGWVGVYHAAHGPVADGHNTDAWDVGAWGNVAIESAAADGGWNLTDDLDFSCRRAGVGGDGVNQVYGMLIAMTEGGVFSNPNDTDVMHPLGYLHRGKDGILTPGSAGPRGPGGLLQNAARWSTLALRCPQIAGVIIDDFWTNYNANNVPPPPPPPPPGTPCPKCPGNRTHMYGTVTAGYYCCTVSPAGGRCPDHSPACCLEPGTEKGCQSNPRCGSNPGNHGVCGGSSYTLLSLEQMKDIKAALSGKQLTNDGLGVDHSSVAQTPWLQLHVVTYDHQLPYLEQQPLIDQDVVDGLSFWISGPGQDTSYANLTSLVHQVRQTLSDKPTFPIFTGGYVTYSSIGWMAPDPFWSLLQQSVALYESNVIQGFYVFAGDVLSAGADTHSHMNATIYDRFDFPRGLAELVTPNLGTVAGRVVSGTGSAVNGFVATVVYNGTTHVTRKMGSACVAAPKTAAGPTATRTAAAAATGASKVASNCFSFGGWSGLAAEKIAAHVTHTITVEAPGYQPKTVDVRVANGTVTTLDIVMEAVQEHYSIASTMPVSSG